MMVAVTEWFAKLLIDTAQQATALTDSIDITDILLQNPNELLKNKVVFTITYFLDGIYLNHNGICLKWDKRKFVNSTSRLAGWRGSFANQIKKSKNDFI
jgi:hypothetical protein